jgi:alpha-ketoglutarate-dependent taurine dioxygenase
MLAGTDGRMEDPSLQLSMQHLYDRGWMHLSSNEGSSAIDLLSLAQLIGTPVHQSNIPLIQPIVPRSNDAARHNTTSALYGLNAFPPHTDAAHWPNPPRYVLFQCYRCQSNTPTMIVDANPILNDTNRANDLARAVWQIRRVTHPFLCSAIVDGPRGRAFRWDPAIMIPASSHARQSLFSIAEQISSICRDAPITIQWHPGDILVIDNWRMLHWRPSIAPKGGPRVLCRIFVTADPTS